MLLKTALYWPLKSEIRTGAIVGINESRTSAIVCSPGLLRCNSRDYILVRRGHFSGSARRSLHIKQDTSRRTILIIKRRKSEKALF